MKVRLIDVDSKIPNLALMKISSFHKNKGDKVGWNVENPDKIYASIIFRKNKDFEIDTDVKIEKGGSGYNLKKELPEEIELEMPDYSIYPECDYSLGFSTRGCIRNCPFCIVPEKEGRFRIHRHPREFHKEGFNKLKLLDNNLLVDKDWFFKITDWILEKGLEVDFNQGLDIRFLDKEVARRLSKLDLLSTLKFAWDNPQIEEKVKEGIETLKEVGINIRSNVQFYVLVNFNTSHREDIYRCKKLKDWGTNPFVMLYEGGDSLTKKLARWANKKWILWACDFKDYNRLKEEEIEEVQRIVTSIEGGESLESGD